MNVLKTDASDLAEVLNLVFSVYLLRFGLIALGIALLVGLIALWMRRRRQRGQRVPAAVPTVVEWVADNGLGEKAGTVVRRAWTDRMRRDLDG